MDECTVENGLDLFLRLQAPWLLVRTGCDAVDKFLNGGFVKGEVTELVGEIAVGKTQFCFSLTANTVVSEEESAVVYLDTNGSFRSKRLMQLLSSCNITEEKARSLLQKVYVARVHNIDDIKGALLRAEDIEKVALLIVDSIGLVMADTALRYTDGGKEEQAEMIARLKTLARKVGCAVVTVNHFVHWRGSATPSLGRRWIKAIDRRYKIGRLDNDQSCYIQSMHSRLHSFSGERVRFKITRDGIISIPEENIAEKTEKQE